MASGLSNASPRGVGLCWAGGAVLAFGALLVAFEDSITRAGGFDAGPWGANFVVLGAIVCASGFWILQAFLDAASAIRVAISLVAVSFLCIFLSLYSEPVLARAVAAAALISGIRGAGFFLGSTFPRLHYQGSMPLGEIAAMTSLLANAIVVTFLIYKSQLLAVDASIGMTATPLWTALFVGSVLVADALMQRFLRRSEASETLEDERDASIKDAAVRLSHLVLVVMLVFVVVQLALGSVFERGESANAALGLSNAVSIAHVLLAMIFLSECGKRGIEVWLYRRARR